MLLRTAIFSVAMFLGCILVAQENNRRTTPPAPIVKSAKALTIDGRLDEPAWQNATVVRADYVTGKVGKQSNQPRLAVRYVWDGDYLYIGYETFDSNLVALPSDVTEGPKTNQRRGCLIWHPPQKVDVVEFFISLGDERFFWELHHNAANQFNDVWCSVFDESWPVAKSTRFPFGIHFGEREFLRDDHGAKTTLAMAVQLKDKSTINKADDKDTGYTAELRIPWHSLGPSSNRQTFVTVESDGKKQRIHGPWKMAGQKLMILAVVQDGDLPQRYHHSSPTFPGGWFHKHANTWPKYEIRSSKSETDSNKQ